MHNFQLRMNFTKSVIYVFVCILDGCGEHSIMIYINAPLENCMLFYLDYLLLI